MILVKTREDFNNEEAYKTYTKTGEFLCHYSWKGKTREQIIYDMALPDYEQKHLDEALGYCGARGEYLGIELDDHIVLLMNMNTPPVDPDEDDDEPTLKEREG